MENNQWHLYDHDPLLLTDVSFQRQQETSSTFHCSNCVSEMSLISPNSAMAADPQCRGGIRSYGRSILGFSLTSPDLVICAGSPDIAGISYRGDSPEMLMSKNCKNLDSSMELSLENGISGSEVKVHNSHKTPTVKFSNLYQTFEHEEELLPPEANGHRVKKKKKKN